MKRMKFTYSLIVLMAFGIMPALAQHDSKEKYEFVKTKAVNKTYTVSANDKVNISNSFGKVEVHTWNKNEVKVDVSVEVSSNKEDYAQKLIDAISISNDQSGNEVKFKTSINGANNSKGVKSNMSIDYSIYMPESNSLKLSNEFGPTTVPDMKSEVDLTSKFGSLNAGVLSNVKKLLVEFGSTTIEGLNNGDASIKYSKATFNKLSGNVKLNFEFCGGVKVNMDNALNGLDVSASYSTVNLRPVSNLSASYTVNTSFGTFKNKSGIKFNDDKEDESNGPKFDYRYEGKSGSGSVPVKVKTSFGKIILGEATEEEMEEKKNKKSKTS